MPAFEMHSGKALGASWDRFGKVLDVPGVSFGKGQGWERFWNAFWMFIHIENPSKKTCLTILLVELEALVFDGPRRDARRVNNPPHPAKDGRRMELFRTPAVLARF